jgi:hypothetical protein
MTLVRAIFSNTTPAKSPLSPTEEDKFPPQWLSWRERLRLAPRPLNAHDNGLTVGVFETPWQAYLILHTWLDDTPNRQAQQLFTQIPTSLMQQLDGNLLPLFDLAEDALSEGALMAANVPPPRLWTDAERAQALETLLTLLVDAPFITALGLLNAALSEDHLIILHHQGATAERLDIVLGLMALLPARARGEFTFNTHLDPNGAPSEECLVFANQPINGTGYHRIHWELPQAGLEMLQWSPYIEHLAAAWQSDPLALMAVIDRFTPLIDAQPAEPALLPRLSLFHAYLSVYEQFQQQPSQFPLASLLEEFGHAERLPREWVYQYAGALLNHVLETRDAEATRLLIDQMNADPGLDVALKGAINSAIAEVPDQVYAFARQHLSERISATWLRRLHTAAANAVQVAVAGTDTALIERWLRLIAREPEDFALSNVLADGIIDALPHAYESTPLAKNLVMITARFAPALLPPLLQDEQLLAALPQPIYSALMQYDRDGLAEMQSLSASLFLVGIARAIAAKSKTTFDSPMIERLLTLYRQDTLKLHPQFAYPPAALIRELTEADWLSGAAQETLLSALINKREDGLFMRFVDHLAAQKHLTKPLLTALQRSGRGVNPTLDTVSMLVANDRLQAEEALDVYMELLTSAGFNTTTQPMLEAIARLIHQHNDLTLPEATLQQLLKAAVELRDEYSAKILAVHLFQAISALPDEEQIVESLTPLLSQITWSSATRNAVLDQWRAYSIQQPVARLSRLDKLLEGARVLEAPLEIVRTVVSVRRLMGKRDAEQLANEINGTYNMLATLAEAFDPHERGHQGFDTETMHALLAEITQTLSIQQMQIAADAFRGLARLIAQMGDNRSKAGLGRRTDNLDRSLMTGEQIPQSAVDAMKWIAGYLGGVQQHATPEDNSQ